MAVTDIKIEPMEVYLGEDVAQSQKITCLESSVAVSLNDTYFLLYSSTDVRYVVWFDVNSTGTDPAISGYTSVPVALGADPSTDLAVATAVQTAVDGLGTFSATVAGNVVTVVDAAVGPAALAHDSQAAKTLFAFEILAVGDLFEKVGFIDGDISASGFASSLVDVTAHQKGTKVLGQIATSGGDPEISFALKEVNFVRYYKILRYKGGPYFPTATSSTAGIGGGSLGQFKFSQNVRMVLHPVRLGLADKSQDYAFWKTTLDLESIAFSGENILTLPVTAKAFEDDTKAEAINIWMYGDWSQNFSA